MSTPKIHDFCRNLDLSSLRPNCQIIVFYVITNFVRKSHPNSNTAGNKIRHQKPIQGLYSDFAFLNIFLYVLNIQTTFLNSGNRWKKERSLSGRSLLCDRRKRNFQIGSLIFFKIFYATHDTFGTQTRPYKRQIFSQ
jgi:hypothetical protein